MVEKILLLTAVINLIVTVSNFTIAVVNSRKKKRTASGASEEARNATED